MVLAYLAGQMVVRETRLVKTMAREVGPTKKSPSLCGSLMSSRMHHLEIRLLFFLLLFLFWHRLTLTHPLLFITRLTLGEATPDGCVL